MPVLWKRPRSSQRSAHRGGLALLGMGLALALAGPGRAGAEALDPKRAEERAEARAGADPADPDRVSVLVHLAPGAERGPLRALAAREGARVRYEYRLALPHTINLRDVPRGLLERIATLPGVVGVEEDRYYPDLVKLHDSIPLVTGLQSQLTAAGLSANGAGVRVCVIDTGIDSNHLMYSARIDAAAGFDFENDDSDPEDDNGHGSHVAGIALGRTGLTVDFGCAGAESFQGVAPSATLIGVKVLDSGGGGLGSNIIAGIDHCADPALPGGRADVINMSLGTGEFSGACDGQHSWADAANNAVAAGVVVVAAAGNEGYGNALASPACGSRVMAIGATYDDTFPSCEDATNEFEWCLGFPCRPTCTDTAPGADDLVCFSNQSTELDVAAPGCVIYSAEFSDPGGDIISSKCGTSMSSPHVAGLAALLLGVDPALTPAEVRQLVRNGALDLGPAGFDPGYGYGRIDVVQSLLLAEPEICGNGSCGPGETGCGCPADCGAPPATEGLCTDGLDEDCDGLTDCEDSDCGLDLACICDDDGLCEPGEDCGNCPNDCFSAGGAACGNGVCEAADGEDCLSCPADCNGRQSGRFSNRFCCGDGDGQRPVPCSDSRCTEGGFACSDVPTVASCCGDAICEAQEDDLSCGLDCAECVVDAQCGDLDACNGVETCVANSCQPGTPPSEVCDGADNDCDGDTDEDFPDLGDACSDGVGECFAAGTFICTLDGSATQCNATAGAPAAETCDGLDNDCDGGADEDFPELGNACSAGTGECEAPGSLICSVDGSGTACSAVPGAPVTELCDGLDNDCDGGADEDFPGLGGACTVGLGECAASGTLLCAADGSTSECDATPFAPSPEVCDGLDNDCDGGADEGAASGSCECGDLDLDGRVGQADIDFYRAHLADPVGAPLSPAAEAQCTVIGAPRPCDILDLAVLRRALATPALPPGVAAVCEAASPG